MRIYRELPVVTYNTKEQEITGKQPDECELMELSRFVDISQVESYQEAIPVSDFREDNKIWTSVVMCSGDTFIVNMTYADFHKMIMLSVINKTMIGR